MLDENTPLEIVMIMLYKIKKIFLLHHASEYILNTSIKVGNSLILAVGLSPIILFFQQTLEIGMGETLFLQIMLIALVSDLASGIVKHLKLKTFDFTALFIGFLIKVFVSFLGMVLINSFAAIDTSEFFTDWILIIGMTLNFIYVGGSAFKNLHVITKGKFPPTSFMNRMKGFNNDLSISNFTKEKESQE